ncbi:Armadillo/beta-catenin-like repeat [Carpediemonas membranifera]|uniref:Armadillo/beta-catenin-like repeat n=1 Tax=Carpediemonas membranifera TaxID=201153 RepID=A0A8J6BAT9_9EUKA|nr:Armadillo/beta-catenin-like repeat [Carpediemonas membranifera]|eukprot:KAG9396854.1 Armadillo/beta-catenin-like repeat [Carpediemonas membranifera]
MPSGAKKLESKVHNGLSEMDGVICELLDFHSHTPDETLKNLTSLRSFFTQKSVIELEADQANTIIDITLPFMLTDPESPEFINDRAYATPNHIFEASWIITNVASGNQTPVVIERGLVPLLCSQIASARSMEDTIMAEKLFSQAVWTLGNIAGERSTDSIVVDIARTGVVAEFAAWLPKLNRRNKAIVMWALESMMSSSRQLCKAGLLSNFDEASSLAMDMVIECVDADWTIKQGGLIDDTMRFLFRVSDHDNELPRDKQRPFVRACLALFFDHPFLQTSIMSAFGNISNNSTEGSSILVEMGCVALLGAAISTSDAVSTRKTAAWTLSNVVVDVPEVAFESDIIDVLAQCMATEKSPHVGKELVYVAANLMDANDNPSVFINSGVIDGMINQMMNAVSVGTKQHRLVEEMLDVAAQSLQLVLASNREGDLPIGVLIELVDEATCLGLDVHRMLEFMDVLQGIGVIDAWDPDDGDETGDVTEDSEA